MDEIDVDDYTLVALDREGELPDVRAPTATRWHATFPDAAVKTSAIGDTPKTMAQRYQRALDVAIIHIKRQGTRLTKLVAEEVGRPVTIASITASRGNVIVEFVIPRQDKHSLKK